MAAVDYGTLAGDILAGVGGEENVGSVVHCATRLRFRLIKPELADKEKVTALPGVITVVESGGQFQVVIGNNVPRVFAALPKDLTSDEGGAEEAKGGSWLTKAVDVLSGVFAPILGPLAAVGILKGLLLIALSFGWMTATSTTYQILFAASDGFFIFLPLMLAVTAARKFGAAVFTSTAIAGSLVYTSLITITLAIEGETDPFRGTLNAFGAAGNSVHFFGIPVVMQSYTSTVIPIVLAVWVQSHLERQVDKIMHESVRNFLTPLVSLVIMVPLTLITIGPAGVWLSNTIAAGLLAVQGFSPALFGALLAGVWQILVIFGVHWGIVPVFINNIATQGWDSIKPPVFPSNFSQAGAALGVFLRVKDPKQKALAGSAALTGIFGITEPAIYGVTLPRKRPFVIAVLAAAIGGAIVGGGGTIIYGTGIPSVLTLPIGFGDPMGFGSTFHWLLLGSAAAYILAVVGVFFFGFAKADLARDRAAAAAHHAGAEAPSAAVASTAVNQAAIDLLAPVSGRIVPLTEVNDKVFSSGAMGSGVGIVPESGSFVAPVDGTVTVSAGHAFGLVTDEGVEVLVHIGIDTVTLAGAPFTGAVAQDAKVKAGDPLVEADLEAIKAAGLDTTTVLIVTNSAQQSSVDVLVQGSAVAGEPALLVTR